MEHEFSLERLISGGKLRTHFRALSQSALLDILVEEYNKYYIPEIDKLKDRRMELKRANAVREKLLSQGICEYPVKCDYCDEDGRVETDNNGPIGKCPICNGTKQYMVSV